LSRIGIGCRAFGGGEYWGDQNQKDADAVVRMAVEKGLNAFDTARLSGDEFAVLLPDTGAEHARILAERIREQANRTLVDVPETPDSETFVPIKIRAGIGIAAALTHANSMESLFDTADNARRKAKDLGRDRVEIAETGICSRHETFRRKSGQ
jgi:diguanylate cyclase (GGDEF)-like protein